MHTKLFAIKATVIKATVLGTVLLGLAACSGYSLIAQYQPEADITESGLERVKHASFDEVYIQPNAALSGYEALNIEHLDLSNTDIPNAVISGALRRDWAMNPEREQKLQKSWMRAMQLAFRDDEYAKASESGLRISAKLIRIAPSLPSTDTISSVPQLGRGVAEFVEVITEIRGYDQDSDALLLFVRDRGTIGAMQWSRTEQTDMGLLFNRWATQLESQVSRESVVN